MKEIERIKIRCISILVRYLREISILLQKQSSRQTPSSYENPSESSLPRTRTTTPQDIFYETKQIYLRSSFVFRRFSSTSDSLVLSPFTVSNRNSTGSNHGSILDIVVPSTQTLYSVRFVDDMYARNWFYIIQAKISRYLIEMLPEIEENLAVTRHCSEVRAMGWLSEQINHDDSTEKSWRPVFLVITDSELCFFSTIPVSKQHCRDADAFHPILSCRLSK